MAQGRVKGFKKDKGCGLIERVADGDLFAHFSSSGGNGFKTLSEGDYANFEEGSGANGPRALRVRRL